MDLYTRKTEATRMLIINLQKHSMTTRDMEKYVTDHFGLSARFIKRFIYLNESNLDTTPEGFRWKE